MEKYLTDLLEWYSGEVGGEVFFLALSRGTADPRVAAKLQKLAQLEQDVASRIRLALEARGVPLPPADADLERGLSSARPYAGLTWLEALDRLRPELVSYVRDFEAAESRMPEDLMPLARFVTDHERALLEFVTRELENNGHHSLDSVVSLLGQTNPPRAGGAPVSY